MQYLVTTSANRIPPIPLAMLDGTTPGWIAKPEDMHFDHHRVGGAEIQIDEMELILPSEADGIKLIVTTQVDADACVAAAWLQLQQLNSYGEDFPWWEDLAWIQKFRAIAYDCDHHTVPDDLAHLADFAAQAVAALKSEGFKVASQLGLPEDRKQWSEEQKELYASECFKQGTEWLIAAVKGGRPWPGEMGEAAEYWQQVQRDEQQLIDENRIIKYKDALIFSMMGWQGRYVDPRAPLRAAKQLGVSATLTLTQRETKDGWSYTLASSAKNLLSKFDAFRRLTTIEAMKRDVDPDLVTEFWGKPEISDRIGFDPWGGREAVGGSGWRTPSLLQPDEVINCLM